jgi:hypothetical protein
MLISAATVYSAQVCNTKSRSYIGLRSGGVVLLVGARLLGGRQAAWCGTVDVTLVGVVHGRPTIEAPLVGKSSQNPIIRLLHHFSVTVWGEVIVGKAWQLSSAASFDTEVDEVFLVHLGEVRYGCE